MATALFSKVYNGCVREKYIYTPKSRGQKSDPKFFTSEELLVATTALQKEVEFILNYKGFRHEDSLASKVPESEYVEYDDNNEKEEKPEYRVILSRATDRLIKLGLEEKIYDRNTLKEMGYTEEDIEDMSESEKRFPYGVEMNYSREQLPHEIFMGIFFNSILDMSKILIPDIPQPFPRMTYGAIDVPPPIPFDRDPEMDRFRDPITANVFEEQLFSEEFVTLDEFIINQSVDTEVIGNILKYIFTVLKEMYTRYYFTHYDLHASNILVSTKTGEAKIIDFGTSYIHIPEDYNKTYLQTTGKELNIPPGSYGVNGYGHDLVNGGYWFHDVSTLLFSLFRLTDYVSNNRRMYLLKRYQRLIHFKYSNQYNKISLIRYRMSNEWYKFLEQIADEEDIPVPEEIKPFKNTKRETNADPDDESLYVPIFEGWWGRVYDKVRVDLENIKNEVYSIIETRPEIVTKHKMFAKMIYDLFARVGMKIEDIELPYKENYYKTLEDQPDEYEKIFHTPYPQWDMETGKPVDKIIPGNSVKELVTCLHAYIQENDVYTRPCYDPRLASIELLESYLKSL